jgi:hypothetical protein
MKMQLIKITPAMANTYLSKNDCNRTVRVRYMECLANDMRQGRWVTTHQGICLSEDGRLIDGQHRLLAIVASGVTVLMWVCTEIKEKTDDGKFTFDAIDRGSTRGIGDQLYVRHGIKNANRVAAMCTTIATICLRSTSRKHTVGTTLEIYNIYKKAVDAIEGVFHGNKLFTNSKVAGALAFCYNAMPSELDDFILQLDTGENIKRGDPAYALRNALINGGHSTNFQEGVYWVGTAAYYHVKKEQVKQLKISAIGIDFFSEKQPRMVGKIREAFGMRD